jgi:hypothetical protein
MTNSLYVPAGSARNLTGTGGITFYCAGGKDELSTTNPHFFGGGQIEGVQSSGRGWITTKNDPIRIYGNPFDPTGRNFGTTFDPTKYYMNNTGPGAPGEPGGGTPIGVTTGNVIVDGLQMYIASTNAGGEGFYVHVSGAQAGDPIVIRNCRVMLYQDGAQPTGSGDTPFTVGQNGLNLTIENCAVQYYPNEKHNGPAITITAMQTGTVNLINCTFAGCAGAAYLDSAFDGTLNITNCALFNFESPPVFVNNQGAGAINFDHCASDVGQGTNAVHWTNGATDWDNNFESYPGSNVNFVGTYYIGTNFGVGSSQPFNISLPVADFRLKNTSARIYAAGTSTAPGGTPTTDIIGTRRKSPPDIGAWELGL